MEISFDEIKRSPFEEIGSQYQFLGNISSGSFGLVVKALDINTKEEVSIKIINKLSHKIDIFRIKEEINILKRLKHPNILKFYDYIETNSKVYIIMELLKGGTLREWIKKHKNENISEEKSSLIIKNILLAISYLHNKNICHRDIKPENIMFKDNSDINSLKLIDFGLSVKNFDDYGEQTYCGTFIYMAPEQLENTFYSKIIDIWSIGIILYELLNKGEHPFYIKGITKKSELIKNIKKHDLKCKYNVSVMGENLIRKMLENQPTIRISAYDALKHPWITRCILDPIPLNLYQKMFKVEIYKKLLYYVYIILFLNLFNKNNKKSVFIIDDEYIQNILKENEIHKKKFFIKRLKEFMNNINDKENDISNLLDEKINYDENSHFSNFNIKQSTNASTDKTINEYNTNIINITSKNSNYKSSKVLKSKYSQKLISKKNSKSPIQLKMDKIPIRMTKIFLKKDFHNIKKRNSFNNFSLKNFASESLPTIDNNQSYRNYPFYLNIKKLILPKFKPLDNNDKIKITSFKLFNNNKNSLKNIKKNYKSSSFENLNSKFETSDNTRNIEKHERKNLSSLKLINSVNHKIETHNFLHFNEKHKLFFFKKKKIKLNNNQNYEI